MVDKEISDCKLADCKLADYVEKKVHTKRTILYQYKIIEIPPTKPAKITIKNFQNGCAFLSSMN